MSTHLSSVNELDLWRASFIKNILVSTKESSHNLMPGARKGADAHDSQHASSLLMERTGICKVLKKLAYSTNMKSCHSLNNNTIIHYGFLQRRELTQI